MEWLKGALATVYSKDGLVGAVVVVGVVGLLLWLFGGEVLGLLLGS